MTEEWRSVVGYEGEYEVSSEGRVRSLDKVITHYTGSTFVRRGRMLSPHKNPKGYFQVTLSSQGRTKTMLVHWLVASAFLGPKPLGLVVRHRDGKSGNAAASNLRYGTNQDNSDDMREHGTVLRGNRHGRAKLIADQVVDIRAQRYAKTEKALAAEYGVSKQLISRIHARSVWKHIA